MKGYSVTLVLRNNLSGRSPVVVLIHVVEKYNTIFSSKVSCLLVAVLFSFFIIFAYDCLSLRALRFPFSAFWLKA